MNTTITANLHVRSDTDVQVSDLSDETSATVGLCIGEVLGCKVTLLGPIDQVERVLDEALLQVVRLKAAKQSVPHDIALLTDLHTGDAISFDGLTWVRLTATDEHPAGLEIALTWEADGHPVTVTLPSTDAVRRRTPAVHALDARVA